MDTVVQDLQRQFKYSMKRDIPFKLTFERVYSEPNRQGTAGIYIVISVRQSDADDAKAFFASHFGNTLHDVAGKAFVYVPLGGASPNPISG